MKMNKKEEGSIELIVLGLLAALIVVLAIPLISGIGKGVQKNLTNLNSQVGSA